MRTSAVLVAVSTKGSDWQPFVNALQGEDRERRARRLEKTFRREKQLLRQLNLIFPLGMDGQV